jgi:hypothetical protein
VLNLDHLDKADLEASCSWRVYKGDRAITFSVEAGGITIATHSCDEKGSCIAELARNYAPIHRIPVHYGDLRLLGCPDCGRRCRILYSLAVRVGCRFCLGLLYSSENMGPRDRAWWAVMKIRRRIDANASTDEFPARRPRMKRRIYRQLVERHNAKLARLN